MSNEVRGDLLVRVASMYYRQQMTQAEIAKQVNLSRQTVSRFLREAEALGIVTVDIRDPSSAADDLGARLVSRFGLAAATVVDVGADGEDQALAETTRRAAVACYPRIAASSVIAMLWGPTVLTFSRSLPRSSHPDLTITQMGGMIPTVPGRNALDPAVSAAAETLSASADLIAAPLYVDNPTIREAIMSDSRIAATLEHARRADMYIFSVGQASTSGGLYQSGYVTKAEIDQLEHERAVGELCGLFYSLEGEPCGAELESRTVAISRDEIRAIPQRILVAVGASKAEAVFGAFAGGYATEAFLDAELARAVLELTEPRASADHAWPCPVCRTALAYVDGRLVRAHPDDVDGQD
jgi:DNA-binding transcriptional regulator LsrR (DeoR family)